MKRLALALLGTLLATAAACEKDDDDNGDDGGSASQGTTQGNTTSSMTTSTEETCVSDHSCINDVCQCDTPGLEGMACTDDTACEEECEVCM